MNRDRLSAYHSTFEAKSLKDALQFEHDNAKHIIALESRDGNVYQMFDCKMDFNIVFLFLNDKSFYFMYDTFLLSGASRFVKGTGRGGNFKAWQNDDKSKL